MAIEVPQTDLEVAAKFLPHFVEIHLDKPFPAPPREATKARLRASASSDLNQVERALTDAHKAVVETFVHDDWQNRMRANSDLLLVRWQLGRFDDCLELVDSLIRIFGGHSGLFNLGAADLFYMKGCILESKGCSTGAASWFCKSLDIRRKNLMPQHPVLTAAEQAYRRTISG